MGQYANFLSRLINSTLANSRTGSEDAKTFWLKQLEKLVNRYTSMCNKYNHPKFIAECQQEKKDMFVYIIDFAKILGVLDERNSFYVVKLPSGATCFSREGEVVSCDQS